MGVLVLSVNEPQGSSTAENPRTKVTLKTMWRCHKCDKPVYFAERKQSLGYDWHPECLRCEECGKRLNPGQHAEHKGVPYCHVPCYGALFGPQLFGHGTRVESHKSFGQKGTTVKTATNGSALPRSHLETKLKAFNQYVDGRSGEIRSREVNGRLVLEGALRIHWGVKGVIHLKENDDQRTVVTVRKRNSCRYSINKGNDTSPQDDLLSTTSSDTGICIDQIEKTEIGEISSRCSADSGNQSSDCIPSTLTPPPSPANAAGKNASTLPSKLTLKPQDLDELDQLLQVERVFDENEKLFQTMPTCLPSQSSVESTESISLSNSDSTSEISSNSQSSLSSPQESVSPSDPNLTLKCSPEKSHINCASYIENIGDYDDETLKPSTDVDLKRLLNRNNFMPLDQEAMSRSLNDDTLKANSPIDPKKINDSLKLYGDIVRNINMNEVSNNIDNFSINCENKLEEFSTERYFNDDHHPRGTLRRIRNYEENLAKKNNQIVPPKNNSNNYNRAISMDNSWIGSIDNSPGNENYELSRSISGPEHFNRSIADDSASDNETINYAHPVDDYIVIPNEGKVVVKRVPNNRTGSTAIKRRTGKRRQRAAALKRRCSINGHFYNRETSFFTPPYGSLMSVWVTSLVSTQEVINLMLDKYKVDSNAQRFALFVVRDNGEQRRLRDDEYPLLVRVNLGPHEEITRLFLMDADKTGEVSSEVAQFLNLSIHECEAILQMYHKEEQRETARIQERYNELRKQIKSRMENLKVRL